MYFINMRVNKEVEMKLYQSARMYIRMDGKYRWLTTPEIAEKVVGADWEKQVREYVDDQEIFNTLGKPIAEWPEVEEPVTPRRWAIAGTCMNRPDWYAALGRIGFTHIYHNRACGMDMDRLERMGIKVIINYTGEDEAGWLKTFNAWGNKIVCGGSWLDDSGHEPDISRRGEKFENWMHRLAVRVRFCKFIRDRSSDVFGNPVVEMMDNTGSEFPGVHPGWSLAFSDKTHDLLLVDIYPDSTNPEDMISAMQRSWNKFIKVYPHKHQVVIQMCAYGNSYWPGYIRTQYNFWKAKMNSVEFENPYKTPMGVCWYKQETWMQSEEMMEEMRDVVKEVMTGG